MIQLLLLPAGVSYFVFNETLDVYSGADENVKKFQTAGIEFIESIAMIGAALPFYKLYPTKPYRNYLQKLNTVHKLGMSNFNTLHRRTAKILCFVAPDR